MERHGRTGRRKSPANPAAQEKGRRIYGAGANDDEGCTNSNLIGPDRSRRSTIDFNALDATVPEDPRAVLNRRGQVVDVRAAFLVFGTAEIAWTAGCASLHVERHRGAVEAEVFAAALKDLRVRIDVV